MHSLLKRQLKRHFGDQVVIPAEWRAFLDGVDEAYRASDTDRAMLERSLELSSQEMLEANSEMRAVFQAIPDLVFRLNPQGVILDVKAGAAGELMIARQDLIGKRIQDTPLQEVAQQFAEAVERVTAKNAPVIIEYSAVLQDQESNYEARLVPLPDRQIVVIIRNITERKMSLRLLGAAVEQSTEAIVITDAELDQPGPRILFVNPAFTRMTGYLAAEVLGQTPRILQGPKSDRDVLRRLRENLDRGETFAGETVNYHKDGTEFNIEWQVTPIRNSSGKTTHFVGIQRDITARKRAEAELEQAHRELLEVSRRAGMAEIATNVLHNVGNVLNSVNISSGLIAEGVKKLRTASLARVVALLREHPQDLGAFITQDPSGKHVPAHLAQLTEHLLADQKTILGELDSLRRNVEHIKEIVTLQETYATFGGVKERVSVVSLVEDSLRMNEGDLNSRQVEVVREFEPVPPVNVEKHKILQILVNLVRNARHACDDSGRADKRLTVRVANGQGRIRISVTDNGVGIPPENLTRIFNHGFTTRKNGHGFGLHSAALAAREMGGALAVHSAGPGTGATFTLELPCGSPKPEDIL